MRWNLSPNHPTAGTRWWIRQLLYCVLAVSTLGCAVNPQLKQLGLNSGVLSGVQAASTARLKFPSRGTVLLRFTDTDVPAAWAEAAHAGVLMHFPLAQRQQAKPGGLQWLVRWPQLPANSDVWDEPAAVATKGSAAGQSAEAGANRGFRNRLGRLGQRVAKVGARWLQPSQWRRDSTNRVPMDQAGSNELGSQPLAPTPVAAGIVHVVVSDQISGQILAQAEVQIHRSMLAEYLASRRGESPERQARYNRQVIGAAFAQLASNIVASGRS